MNHIESLKPPRSLQEVVDQLRGEMKRLPLNDPKRGPISMQIVGLEDELTLRAAKTAARQ